MRIGVIIPATSRGRDWSSGLESYLCQMTLKSFCETCDPEHVYNFYIGIDADDPIYSKTEEQDAIQGFVREICGRHDINIELRFIPMTGIKRGHLTKMWNVLFELALADECDYFFQCGDDIVFQTKGWVGDCIKYLRKSRGIGVIGPHNGHSRLLTQSFVSRTHYDIFGYYFPEEIENWFCDDWINDVYGPYRRFLHKHLCVNLGGKPRYAIKGDLDGTNPIKKLCDELVTRDRKKIEAYRRDPKKVRRLGQHSVVTS